MASCTPRAIGWDQADATDALDPLQRLREALISSCRSCSFRPSTHLILKVVPSRGVRAEDRTVKVIGIIDARASGANTHQVEHAIAAARVEVHSCSQMA